MTSGTVHKYNKDEKVDNRAWDGPLILHGKHKADVQIGCLFIIISSYRQSHCGKLLALSSDGKQGIFFVPSLSLSLLNKLSTPVRVCPAIYLCCTHVFEAWHCLLHQENIIKLRRCGLVMISRDYSWLMVGKYIRNHGLMGGGSFTLADLHWSTANEWGLVASICQQINNIKRIIWVHSIINGITNTTTMLVIMPE